MAFRSPLIMMVLCMVSGPALAAGHSRPAIDGYFKEIARSTGKTEKEVRETAVEALRSRNRFSESDLERIRLGEPGLSRAKQTEVIGMLNRSRRFKSSVSELAGSKFERLTSRKQRQSMKRILRRVDDLRKLTPVLREALKLADDAVHVRTSAYRLTEVPELKSGENEFDAYERAVKYSLHRDFPITGDEDGYSFRRLFGETPEKEVAHALKDMNWLVDFSRDSEGRVSYEKTLSVVQKALQKDMMVLIGTGSGNNTHAEMIVIVDRENNQFITLIASNFGSDS